ncbi:MAG TPA: hypothetical protein VI864_07380 [Candidatus Bathyarchaeia archaeon]|nr:hypothetical protein [Candidatus Bathyarchaeia archaeon]
MFKLQRGIKKKGWVAILVLILVITFSAQLALGRKATSQFDPMVDCHVVKEFPRKLTVGYSYEAEYKFRNIAKSTMSITVHFTIHSDRHVKIKSGEWIVLITINQKVVKCTEVKPGVFETKSFSVNPKSWRFMTIKVTLSANVVPSNYKLETDLLSKK